MTTSPRPRTEVGCLMAGATAFLIAIAAGFPALLQMAVVSAVWIGDVQKQPYTPQQALLFSLLQIGLLLPLGLGLLLRAPRYRAVAQTLLVANICAALLLIVRVVLPPSSVAPAALARLAITTIFALPLCLLAIQRGSRLMGSGAGVAAAALLGAIGALPWVRVGAFGDRIDLLLACAQGFELGLLMAGLHGAFLAPALREEPEKVGWNLALSTATMVAACVGIGGAFGQDDLQAIMMPVLATAGVLAAAVALPDKDGRTGLLAPALVVGLVASVALAMVDPEEIALVVALSDDTYKYTQRAATLVLMIGILAWGAAQLAARRLPALGPTPIVSGLALASWLAVGAAYATSGNTGFYGNHAFVVLKEQADLSGAEQIADLTERRRFVYTTLAAHADRTQADLRALLDARGVRYTPFYLVNAIEVDGDLLLQQELERRPEVDRIVFSQALRPLPEPLPLEAASDTSPPGIPTWNITQIGADRVWDELGVTGAGIVIGQSDSGVDWQHPALRESYRGKGGQHDYNWLDPWTGAAEPWDGNGHGTHTLGSVLGAGGIGVAPGATWFGCANLVRNIGNPPDYLHCMQFLLAPYPIGGDPLHDGDPARAADVSTNSWGCPPIEGCDRESLLPGMRALRAAGIFVVAAAGNEGPACDSLRTPPGNYAALISVGAVDEYGDLAEFSSRGPETDSPDGRAAPTLLAPGVDVLSAWPGGGYAPNSGTSMATPHVAGVVALIWSANPSLRGDVDATEQILIETAQPYLGALEGCGAGETGSTDGGEPGLPNPESGYGIVDAYAAVQRALAQR